MKIISLIARYLLGFMFTVIGINGFFHFIPEPPQVLPLASSSGPLQPRPILSCSSSRYKPSQGCFCCRASSFLWR
jgi:hypothetical protein